MEKPDLDVIVAKWQKILRLQDWRLTIVYERHYDMADGASGTCSFHLPTKSAKIRILDPADRPNDCWFPADLERTVVHELLHLHIGPFDHSEGAEHSLMEQSVDCISMAVVMLDRAPKSA